MKRVKIRLVAKLMIFSLVLYLECNNKLAAFKDEIPTFFEYFVLSVFYGAMGTLDELYDTVKIVKV